MEYASETQSTNHSMIILIEKPLSRFFTYYIYWFKINGLDSLIVWSRFELLIN